MYLTTSARIFHLSNQNLCWLTATTNLKLFCLSCEARSLNHGSLQNFAIFIWYTKLLFGPFSRLIVGLRILIRKMVSIHCKSRKSTI